MGRQRDRVVHETNTAKNLLAGQLCDNCIHKILGREVCGTRLIYYPDTQDIESVGLPDVRTCEEWKRTPVACAVEYDAKRNMWQIKVELKL